MMGALLEETECLFAETAMNVLRDKDQTRRNDGRTNRKALAAGREFIDNYVRVGAVSQPDGFRILALSFLADVSGLVPHFRNSKSSSYQIRPFLLLQPAGDRPARIRKMIELFCAAV